VVGVDAFTDYYDPSLKRRNLAVALSHPEFRLLELDLGVDDLAALPEAAVVFHQAAQPGVRASWGRQFEAYTRHNVLATQRLLERYRGARLERFVYASSSSVYGDAERYPTDEGCCRGRSRRTGSPSSPASTSPCSTAATSVCR